MTLARPSPGAGEPGHPTLEAAAAAPSAAGTGGAGGAMADRKTHLDGVAIASLLLCCTLWGLNTVATKVALADFPPLTQAAVRSLGAALLVLAWARWRGIALFERDGTFAGGMLTGALFGAEFALIFTGLQYTGAARMVVFVYLSPFVVALGMPFIARSERLNGVQWTGLAIAFAGVAWAFAEGFTRPALGERQWLGDAMGIGAAVMWGASTLSIRATKLSTAAPEKTLLYQLVVSGVLLGLGAWLLNETWPTSPAASSVGWLTFQIVVVTFASYLLWFWLVRHYPATRVAAFVLLTPISGLVAGAVLLGEPVTLRLLVAVIAVALGILLVQRR